MYLIVLDTLKDIFLTTKCTLKFESKYSMGIKPFHTILFNQFYYQVKHVFPHIAWKSIGAYFHSPIKQSQVRKRAYHIGIYFFNLFQLSRIYNLSYHICFSKIDLDNSNQCSLQRYTTNFYEKSQKMSRLGGVEQRAMYLFQRQFGYGSFPRVGQNLTKDQHTYQRKLLYFVKKNYQSASI